MGKNLFHTIEPFFRDRMQEHSIVASCVRLRNDDEIIYEIRRHKYEDTVRVWLSDAYDFTEADFDARPREIGRGDYILVAKPEGHCLFSPDVSSGIRSGKLSDLMGALNMKNTCEYVSPEEREERKRARERMAKLPGRR